MTTRTKMTKAEARRRANRQLSYGHFRPQPGTAYVTCPECRQQIRVEFHAWKEPSAFLRLALVSHLIEEH
jgi:hypothetical protein